jgi:hypothetical protein
MIEFDGSHGSPPSFLTRYVGFIVERGFFQFSTKILPSGVDPGNAKWTTGQSVWLPVNSNDPNFRRRDIQEFRKVVASVTDDSRFQTRSVEFIARMTKMPTLDEYKVQSWPLRAGNMIMSGGTSQATGPTPIFDKVLEHVAKHGAAPPLRQPASAPHAPLPVAARSRSFAFIARHKKKLAAAAAALTLATGAWKISQPTNPTPETQKLGGSVTPSHSGKPTQKRAKPNTARPRQDLEHHKTTKAKPAPPKSQTHHRQRQR